MKHLWLTKGIPNSDSEAGDECDGVGSDDSDGEGNDDGATGATSITEVVFNDEPPPASSSNASTSTDAGDEMDLSASDSGDGSSSDEDMYELEKLVGRRMLPNGTVEYKVKWKGWHSGYNSWEATEN